MAIMFPTDVERFTTAGEQKVYEFLRKAARPDELFLVWYSPDIEDREPDFILYSPDSGLIVLEVKDWIPGQVLEANPKYARLRIGQREENRKQPLAQAKEYVHGLLGLLGKKSGGAGNIPCPVTWGAVFPHMLREEFRNSGLAAVMEERRVLCWDDLAEGSPLERDASGHAFRNFLLEHFPPLFPFSLDLSQLNWLRAAIFPVVRINIPSRGPSRQEETIMALDHAQENLARSLGLASLLIAGPAGSGKTLILAHRAWQLPRVDKNIRRILVTCFNLSLVGYIRRLLAKKGVGLGENGVEVIPFYGLCEKILGERISHASEGADYYGLVVAESLERLEGDHPLKGRWDAILVDEGQDFTPGMAKLVLSLLPKNGVITICEDENQRLYHREIGVWENAGLSGLKKRRLDLQYRNTAQIAQMAAKALGHLEEKTSFGGSQGERPRWLVNADEKGLISDLADEIANTAAKGMPPGEMAVLYVSSKLKSSGSLPEEIVRALEERGILASWIARDVASKRAYDITTDSVTVSSIHSVKGLDYAHVFLLGLDRLDPAKEGDRRLAHVGITRAREGLAICVNSCRGLALELREKDGSRKKK